MAQTKLDKLFKLSERKTNTKTEIMAGVTTFLTMSYILVVNPLILSDAGMDFSKVFAATAISSVIATLLMAFLANLPLALAPGMGLNAFLSYTVCLGMGYSWQFAITAVFVEGIIFIILTLCNIREAIVNSIPASLKKAVSVGIGLFIAFIGFQNSKLVVDSSNLVQLNPNWMSFGPEGCMITLCGIIFTAVLLAYKVRGALLIGIVFSTILGIPFGVTNYAGGSFLPPAPYFLEFDFANIFDGHVLNFVIVVFTFLFFDMFDTVGTLIGCATKTNMLKEDGSIPNCKEALLADAVGTTVGAMLGTTTVTTFVESSSGIIEGGRTGLTALTTAILFAVALFLEPLFGSIPSAATAPALIIVGVMMMTPVTQIDWNDMTEAIPAFLTLMFMVCAYSISDGIMFGLLSYVIIKTFTKQFKKIAPMTWVVAGLFMLKVIADIL